MRNAAAPPWPKIMQTCALNKKKKKKDPAPLVEVGRGVGGRLVFMVWSPSCTFSIERLPQCTCYSFLNYWGFVSCTRCPPLPHHHHQQFNSHPTWSDHSDLMVSSEKIRGFIQGAAGTTGVGNTTILTLLIGLNCVIQPPGFLCPAEKIFHSFSHSGRFRISLSLVANSHSYMAKSPKSWTSLLV